MPHLFQGKSTTGLGPDKVKRAAAAVRASLNNGEDPSQTTIRHALLERGYVPLPQDPATKATRIKQWNSITVTDALVDSPSWNSGWRVYCTALRCDRLFGVDIDTGDDKTCQEVADLVQRILGNTTYVRMSRPGRALLLYRLVGEPVGKPSSGKWLDGDGREHFFELLTGPSATLGAYGRHSDAHDYSWLLDDPIDVPLEELPPAPAERAQVLCEAVMDYFRSRSFSEKEPPAPGSNGDGGPYTKVRNLELDTVFNGKTVREWMQTGYDGEEGHSPFREGSDSLRNCAMHTDARGYPLINDHKARTCHLLSDAAIREVETSALAAIARTAKANIPPLPPPEPEPEPEPEPPPAEPESPLGIDLHRPPGLVGELAKWIRGNMKREQPLYATAAALTTVAMFSENAYVVAESHTSLNIYSVLIGPTTAGKEGPRHNLRLLFKSGEMFFHMQDQTASGAAILRSLHRLKEDNKQPALLFTLDEMGKMLQGAATSLHLADAVTELTRLWGMATSWHPGKAYADSRNAIEPIDHPFVCMLGTTTEETLVDALTSGNVSDGWLGRLLFVITEEPCPPMDPFNNPDAEPPAGLADRLKRLRHEQVAMIRAGKAIKTGEAQPEQMPIQPTEEAKDVLRWFLAETERHANNEEVGPLWARGFEQAVRVSGILAIGEHGPYTPRIEAEHAQWAVAYVRSCIESASRLVRHNVADNPEERDQKKVLRVLRKMAPPTDAEREWGQYHARKCMPRWVLIRRTKLSATKLDDALKTLTQAEQVSAYKETVSSGHPVELYTLLVN